MMRSVLFVDDERNILEALQRMLRPLRNEWNMHFAGGGQEALAIMAASPVDVVVTDMRMPGMDGDELLTRIRQLYPETVRIVLTGQCARGAVMRLIPLAHRMLSKPFDAEGLRTVLRRTYCLRDLLSSPSLASVVGNLGGLPSLPEMHSRVLAELDRTDVSLQAVAAIASEDMGLVTKLMQMANSALFGLRQPITSPVKAIQVLGVEMTRATLMAANVFSLYDPMKLRPFSIDTLWLHSRQTGDLAGRIARMEGLTDRTTDATLAGLLHDVGRLTLVSQMPNEYKDVLRIVRDEKVPVVEAEMRVFGATHAEVGAYLLGLWGLPDPVVEAVAWHHAPSRCPGDQFTPLSAVHAAEAILGEDERSTVEAGYLERLGMGDRMGRWSKSTSPGVP
jgi:HD-like signal output (HDOD) protein/ActR/RegA family two-component response regulator